MARVLVTGGTGFTGRHLVRDLIEDGQAVRVLTRSAERARQVLPADVELVEGDIAAPGVPARCVRGVHRVYHLAASFNEAGIPDERYRLTHVDGTRRLLEGALEEGVERFVHCSTVGVHSHVENPPADETVEYAPGDVYQRTKMEGERLALAFHRRHGLPVAVVRPTPIYGPGDVRLAKMFRGIQKGIFPILGSGEVHFHMVFVEDLVRGFRLAAEVPEAVGEVFIVGGEEHRSLNDLTELIARLLDVPPPRLHLPVAPFYWLGAAVETVCVPLGIEPPIYRRRVGFFVNNRIFSIEKARRVLGYEPRVGLEEGLSRTIRWYRREGLLA